ncbi:MAG TPA: extracellular solute-binding protein [Galbitalea sp.]|nr:extracellular solute-binding protein [Galbitalea sp.]HEX4401286.1 extracellular solute-binding protein [Galbitalea sp.]
MRKSRIYAVGAIGLAAALALSACSSGATGGSSSSIGTPNGKGKTLTVWSMTGDLSAATLGAINKQFTKETGAKVNVQTQQWTGIGTKITTALSTSTPPDVVDLGNTDVASFASSGGLLDLTANKTELEAGQTWLSGLEAPAEVGGKLYAVPSFAGDRVVLYNKTMWAADGITSVPTTYSQLTSDLDTIKSKNTASDFSAMYFPGQYWYAGMGFVWDAGGSIATGSGTSWKGGFGSSAAQQGLNDFKTFQNTYSSVASQTLNTDTPSQDTILADGQASAIVASSWEIGTVEATKKLAASDLGTFPFPGKSGKNQPVFLGGSDWGIAAKSKNAALAKAWVKIAASPSIQSNYVFGHDGWIPNSVQASAAAATKAAPIDAPFFTAAKISNPTPAAAGWLTIEGDNSITEFFQNVATGSVSSAASSFDSHLASALNAG